jgi:hypothetical protein
LLNRFIFLLLCVNIAAKNGNSFHYVMLIIRQVSLLLILFSFKTRQMGRLQFPCLPFLKANYSPKMMFA